MRYAIYKIEPWISYGITISPLDKPDSGFRELIRAQIDKAMSSLEREPRQVHKVAVMREYALSESNGKISPSEPGIPGVPYLKPGGQYLIFVIFDSPDPGSAESLSIQEIETYQEELSAMFAELLDSVKIGLVFLRDCSVTVIETTRGTSKANPRDTQFERALENVRRYGS